MVLFAIVIFICLLLPTKQQHFTIFFRHSQPRTLSFALFASFLTTVASAKAVAATNLHVLHVLHGQRRFGRSARGSPEPSPAAPRQPERSGVFREGLPNRRVLASLRLSHIQQQAALSLPCLGIYHWLRTIRLLRLRAKTTPLVRPSPPHPSA